MSWEDTQFQTWCKWHSAGIKYLNQNKDDIKFNHEHEYVNQQILRDLDMTIGVKTN